MGADATGDINETKPESGRFQQWGVRGTSYLPAVLRWYQWSKCQEKADEEGRGAGGDAWRLYEYITRHFIATVSHDCKYLQSTISFRIGPELFTCSGKTVLSPGFTEIMPWQSVPLEESLPTCQRGNTFTVSEVKMLEKQTSPPDYLTEAELITLMEKHGIGTDASIPVHINNICQRNYVTVESGRRLKPTNLGIVLVHGYYKIDAELVLPTIRSAVEKQLNLIAQGKADYRQVLGHTLDVFKRKFHYFVDSIAGMDELMEVSFSPLAATGKPLSRCGKCHRFMKYIQAKPSRLHCSHCDETYTLPQNGTIKLYKELRCPLDDFELVLWSSGSRGKSYPLCPYCYNHPPFRDMKKGQTPRGPLTLAFTALIGTEMRDPGYSWGTAQNQAGNPCPLSGPGHRCVVLPLELSEQEDPPEQLTGCSMWPSDMRVMWRYQ
ncbi:DNA topoisomerase 3-beta-1 [Saguinus oedipus]|uniref:DNA topoisomerase n=1 Tax=Saguinus oedipus TaxID=9490 RepID=A0ABQ9WHP3_SAGOE|nr:DNA topoisomerase 3-beta-1 [Saguinus oedipus]